MKFAAQIGLLVVLMGGLAVLQGTEWGRAHPWLWFGMGGFLIVFYCIYQVLDASKAHKFTASKAKISGPVKKLVEEFEEAGFKTGDGYTTTVIGGATVIPLVNSAEKTVVAIYMLNSGGVIWEIVCYGQSGNKQVTISTTSSELFGRIIRPGSDVIQILPSMSPTEGVAKHMAAKDFAEDKGVQLTPVNLMDFGRDCERLSRRRSQWVRDHILMVTAKTLMRAMQNRNPDAVAIPSRLSPW